MKVVLGTLLEAALGSALVVVLVLLLGEEAGYPLELTRLEWGLILGAGAAPALLDRVMAPVRRRMCQELLAEVRGVSLREHKDGKLC